MEPDGAGGGQGGASREGIQPALRVHQPGLRGCRPAVLYFASFAYVLMHGLRWLGLAARAGPTALRRYAARAPPDEARAGATARGGVQGFDNSTVGEIVEVAEDVPAGGRTRVVMWGSQWTATNIATMAIDAGARVRVVAVAGATVDIEPISADRTLSAEDAEE